MYRYGMECRAGKWGRLYFWNVSWLYLKCNTAATSDLNLFGIVIVVNLRESFFLIIHNLNYWSLKLLHQEGMRVTEWYLLDISH